MGSTFLMVLPSYQILKERNNSSGRDLERVKRKGVFPNTRQRNFVSATSPRVARHREHLEDPLHHPYSDPSNIAEGVIMVQEYQEAVKKGREVARNQLRRTARVTRDLLRVRRGQLTWAEFKKLH